MINGWGISSETVQRWSPLVITMVTDDESTLVQVLLDNKPLFETSIETIYMMSLGHNELISQNNVGKNIYVPECQEFFL